MAADADDGAAAGTRTVIVPVIMSGGAGSRLWPLSTETTPKQFHRLTSDKTMIQETVLRARDRPEIAFADPILVCNRRHVSDVREQLAAVGVRPSLIVAEPFGRNTAAVALIAAKLTAELHPGASVLLQPADHLIENDDAFAVAIATGARARDRIVTFGIEPTEPHEGYGYIQASQAIEPGLFGVERFVEKPSRAVAEAYLADGGYYWNSGIFLFAPEVMTREFSAFRGDIADAVTAALASAKRADGVLELQDEEFAKIPSESIDVAIMERTRSAAVVACDIGWADIGSWSELWRLGPHDSSGNRLHGHVMVLDTNNTLLWSDGPPVGVIGLDDIVVVAAHGAVLVAAKSHVQKVKAIAAELPAGSAASKGK
jgi:mannose-1-phosphate guanylyltransferase/mannose-6-phosphate isomerase